MQVDELALRVAQHLQPLQHDVAAGRVSQELRGLGSALPVTNPRCVPGVAARTAYRCLSRGSCLESIGTRRARAGGTCTCTGRSARRAWVRVRSSPPSSRGSRSSSSDLLPRRSYCPERCDRTRRGKTPRQATPQRGHCFTPGYKETRRPPSMPWILAEFDCYARRKKSSSSLVFTLRSPSRASADGSSLRNAPRRSSLAVRKARVRLRVRVRPSPLRPSRRSEHGRRGSPVGSVRVVCPGW
jgi:hypothetical protein